MIVGASIRFLEVHIARILIFEGIDPFEEPRKTDIDPDYGYGFIFDKDRLNIRDQIIICALVKVRLCPDCLPVPDRSVIPVFRNGIFFYLFLCKRNDAEFTVAVTGIVNALLAVGNTGNIKRIMDICALDKIIVLSHETDKIIRISDDTVTEFSVFGDPLNVRDLVPRPSGKRSDRIFHPQELGIQVISALFAEQVHLCSGILCKYPVGKDYAYRHESYGKQKRPDNDQEYQSCAKR